MAATVAQLQDAASGLAAFVETCREDHPEDLGPLLEPWREDGTPLMVVAIAEIMRLLADRNVPEWAASVRERSRRLSDY